MEKALPWIIGILALLVIWACVEVGWLYSFLTISIICCILYVTYSLIRKLAKEGATENDQKIANTTLKTVVGIAIILIIIGAILAGVGLFNPSTDGYKLQKCGYCGGSGRLTSGKACGLCDGAGGTAYEHSVCADFTWLGILMAASGAVLYMGMAVMKNTIDNTTKATSKKIANDNTTISATPKPISSNNVQHESISQVHKVYMLIDEVTPNLEHPERLFEIKGNVVRGNIYGQQVVILKSHITGETAKFKVAGQGLKGKVGDRARLNVYGTEGGKLNVTIGDSLYI